ASPEAVSGDLVVVAILPIGGEDAGVEVPNRAPRKSFQVATCHRLSIGLRPTWLQGRAHRRSRMRARSRSDLLGIGGALYPGARGPLARDRHWRRRPEDATEALEASMVEGNCSSVVAAAAEGSVDGGTQQASHRVVVPKPAAPPPSHHPASLPIRLKTRSRTRSGFIDAARCRGRQWVAASGTVNLTIRIH